MHVDCGVPRREGRLFCSANLYVEIYRGKKENALKVAIDKIGDQYLY